MVLKEKDLLMIPNRVAIALQDAGWYIRSEIIWHKPNPMPESVKR
jgi:DNA modification methylase